MVQRETIIRYLQTPMNVGVEHTNIVIPGKAIHDLWEHLKEMSHQKRKRFTIAEPFLEYDFKFAMTVDKWQLARVLDEMLNTMVKWEKDCPKPVMEWSDWGMVVLEPEYAEEIEKCDYYFLPPKEYFPDIKDGISLNVEVEAYPDLAIGVVSLSKEPITKLTSFLSATPKFKEKITFSKINHKYAARYVLDLYPAIAALWIDEMSTGVFPRDIIGMLSDSLEYFYRRDWRTSVVLSSISAEMILAEMYEEAFQRPAPAEPLGTLFDKLMKKGEVAEEVKVSCSRVNQMRKSAVHRGLAPPTIREASLALYGAIQLAFCHYL